jgi:predicted ArsR family transcriptional regulator
VTSADDAAIAALGEPLRRALYRFVAAQTEPVTREQAAAGVGVAQHTAKFHLDHLVDDGLLEGGYRRPPGRGGPGAGRPAKIYRRSDTDLEVSLPERRHDLAGRLLAKAVAQSERTGTPISEALHSVAIDAGRAVGAQAASNPGRRATDRTREAAVIDVLSADGYQPRPERDGFVLTNCPFHALAREETELVCDMNLAYLQGVLDGLGGDIARCQARSSRRTMLRTTTEALTGSQIRPGALWPGGRAATQAWGFGWLAGA